MKRMSRIAIALTLAILLPLALTGCGWKTVEAGHVGVKFNLLGGDKGVAGTPVGPGWYFLSVNQRIFDFPTFTQNWTWTKAPQEGNPVDESLTFQTVEGLSVNTDMGISYHIDPDKVTQVFQKYRKGVDEITNIYLRNMVRDELVEMGSTLSVESVYGKGKADLIRQVEAKVKTECAPIGIVVEKIYYIGDLRLPPQITAAINDKISATQKAQQRENELRQAEAEAKKAVAQAEGEAKSKLALATAEAEALKMKNAALTPQLVQYEAIQKWDGKLPTFSGGGNPVPFVNVTPPSAPPAQ